MGEPLVFYISLVTIRYINIKRDVEPNSKGLYVCSSFQKVRKIQFFEPN